jgi:hypothetical protein
VIPALLEAAVRATGLGPGSLIIEQRSETPHRTNRLYDVWADGRHLIAKEYLSNVDLDAPLNEYRPPPGRVNGHCAAAALFDPSVGPAVVYAYMDGAMWDRRVPATAELVALADVWVALHALPIDDVWVGRARSSNSPSRVARWRAPIERYAAWAAQTGDGARRNAAQVCMQSLERGLADALPLRPEVAPSVGCAVRECHRASGRTGGAGGLGG